MRSRDVVGRKIVQVRHMKYPGRDGAPPVTVCVSLQLDNGSVIRAGTIELTDTTEGELWYTSRSAK